MLVCWPYYFCVLVLFGLLGFVFGGYAAIRFTLFCLFWSDVWAVLLSDNVILNLVVLYVYYCLGLIVGEFAWVCLLIALV